MAIFGRAFPIHPWISKRPPSGGQVASATAGMQDFDGVATRARVIAVSVAAGAQFIASTLLPPAPSIDGKGEFDIQLVRRLASAHLLHGVATAPVGYVANTPITDGINDFDLALFRRPFRSAIAIEQGNTILVPAASAVTPTTGGLQDLVPVLFQRPWRPSGQQVTTNAPASVSVASTPVTAGLQDLAPWLFVKPLRPSLQQDHALAPLGYVANTPQTGGVQGFDHARAKKLSGLWFDPAVSVQATFLWTPPTVAPDMRPRFSRTPDSAGDKWPTVVPLPPAVTPSAFWAANLATPPFRFGMRAALQAFMLSSLRPGIAAPVRIFAQPTILGKIYGTDLDGQEDGPELDGRVG